MSDHTPAPWEARYENYAYEIYAEEQPRGIATVACYPAEVEDANARLIAAAPKLLEACLYLCAEIHNRADYKSEAFMRGVALAEAIIAQAQGHE